MTGGELIRGVDAPVRPVGTARVLNLAICDPGIGTDALSTSLGLPSSYAFEIALCLQSVGTISSSGAGRHPLPGTSLAAKQR